jgi:hypothetical protein
VGARALPTKPQLNPRVITSPAALPPADGRVRVFLGGSIDMGSAPDWQADVINALAGETVDILNPRRDDWSKEWQPVADDDEFLRQVNWELSALESADVIILYLSPGSRSPISLLELGLHARSGKLIVLCPDGYWRKGNVDITVRRYGVEEVADIESLLRSLRGRLERLTSYTAEPRQGDDL